jgi:hypothetical protein
LAWTTRTDVESGGLDPRDLALVRLAALVAVGGAVPSFGAQADAAVSAGATAAEIVDVLVGVVPIVGLPRVVAAAPNLAMALAARARTPYGERRSVQWSRRDYCPLRTLHRRHPRFSGRPVSIDGHALSDLPPHPPRVTARMAGPTWWRVVIHPLRSNFTQDM